MKRLLLSLATVLALPACGLYTNVPAQIHVASIKPATVTYQKPDSDGFREIRVEPAEVTFIGEPGSIGVTFEELLVDYFTDMSPGKERKVAADLIAPLTLRATVRVGSSNYPSDPSGQPMELGNVGRTVQVGKGTFQLPIITRHVEDYGLRSNVNAGALTAQVILTGNDDAGFPVRYSVYVPITFHGAPGQGGS